MTLMQYVTSAPIACDVSALTLFLTALLVRREGRRRWLLALSLLLCVRYMVWRVVYTISTDDVPNLLIGSLVYLVELYELVQLCFYAYLSWAPYDRPLEPLTRYPTVEILVTVMVMVVDEPLAILRQTLVGSLAQEYPPDRFIVKSIGVTHLVGNWAFTALAGPQLGRIEQERVGASSTIDHQIGAYGQLEAMYWHEKGSLHMIGSYADLDDFFWGRVRGKLRVTEASDHRYATYAGWDVAGMRNADFRAFQTGPVYEVNIGKVFVLGKVGYQYSTSFHSGLYGGLEVYFPF